jgi:quercetin dioxygenase-like cupin family protein
MGTVTPVVQVDDGRVRVARWTLHRGEDTGRHRHAYDYVVVPLTDARMTVVDVDGTRSTYDLRTGVSYARTAGVEHTVGNEDDATLDFVEVEIVVPSPPVGV